MAAGTAVVKVATGHDVAGTALVALSPQPHYGGLQFEQENFTPAGVQRNAPYAVLEFPSLDNSQIPTVYAALGVTSAEYANITISLPDDENRDNESRWNGRVIKNRAGGWRYPLKRDPVIIVQLLEEL